MSDVWTVSRASASMSEPPPLKYSSETHQNIRFLKIENLGAGRTLDFMVGEFRSLRHFRTSTTHPHTKFEWIPTIRGRELLQFTDWTFEGRLPSQIWPEMDFYNFAAFKDSYLHPRTRLQQISQSATERIFPPIFSRAILPGLVLRGVWTELYKFGVDIKDPWQVCFEFSICCFLSKPDPPLKGQISHL